MRIGTWNMDGRGTAAHADLLLEQDCDVLLLTEVPAGWSLAEYRLTPPGEPMLPNGKPWTVVASRPELRPPSRIRPQARM